MTDFPREEVQRALETFLDIRAKVEAKKLNWDALADLYTEDAVCVDSAWGRMVGREAIRKWMCDSMQGLEDWTFPIEWTMIDGNRVVIRSFNRLPGQRPDGTYYEAPLMHYLIYAGNGKFSFEEDLYNMAHVMELLIESGWIPGPEVKMPEKVVR